MQTELLKVTGLAVYRTSMPYATPRALLQSVKHCKVPHERNVFLTVEFHERPWLRAEHRMATFAD